MLKRLFFVLVIELPEMRHILKKIKEEGHIIGNHSYSHHFWFDIFSSKKMLDDLKKMDQETGKGNRDPAEIVQATLWCDQPKSEKSNN